MTVFQTWMRRPREGGRVNWGLTAWIGLLLAVVAMGCQTYPPPGGTRIDNLPEADPGPDLLREGDSVEVVFLDIPTPPPAIHVRIAEDGMVTLQFNEKVPAAGRTVSELQDAIRERYVPKYYRRLTVQVRPDVQSIVVSGEVNRPGKIAYISATTVLDAIGTAGDFNNFANRRKVILTRSATNQQLLIDCVKAAKNPSLDLPVYPGDRIEVKRRWF